MPNNYLVYVSQEHEKQIGKWVSAPNKLGSGGKRRYHHEILQEMQVGDFVWFFRAEQYFRALVSICEVLEGFTKNEPHKALPEEHPHAFSWPVGTRALLDPPIHKDRLVELARESAWLDAPFDRDGDFKQGHTYCHRMSLRMVKSLIGATSGTDVDGKSISLTQIVGLASD